ncbi:MAG: hypothetical protein AAF990_18485 [Bacteroidota bacterium]
MNKSKLFYISSIIFMALAFSACDHETDTFDGPNLVDRFGPFNVVTNLGVSQATVDFAAGETVFFTAEFNKNINWVIEITGKESGAVKRIEGFDRVINAENATWDGGTTDLPLFRNEACDVLLTIPEEPTFTGMATVETLSSKQYPGFLFTDFESDAGTDIQIGNFEFELTAGREMDIPSQGESYYRLAGTDNIVANFFVGLVDIKSTVTGQNYLDLPTTVPEELYFNCFMYSDGGLHGLAIIDFAVDADDSGEFEADNDEFYRVATDYDLATWEGWRQISHPMSDTPITEEELGKVVAIRLLLISNMAAQPMPPLQVDYGVDFMIFTTGGPLEL